MIESEKSSFIKARSIISLSVLIMLTFAVNVFNQVQEGYRNACQAAILKNERLLHIVSGEIEQAFIGVENTLSRAEQDYYLDEKFRNNEQDSTVKSLQKLVNDSQFLSALVMVDANGDPLMAAHKKQYENWIDYHQNFLAQEEGFKIIQSEEHSHFITLISKHNTSDKNLIIVGRKLLDAQGTLLGAYIAVINPEVFINYFKIVDPERFSYFSIQMDNGLLAADIKELHPLYSDLNKSVIEQFHNNPTKTTSLVNNMRLGKMVQIYGALHLNALPFILTIVLDENDYLKNWNEGRLKDYGFLTVFLAFGSLLSFMVLTMARQIFRVEKSEAAAVLASQAKSEFLANMSHELRTPLNAIIGFSEMMNSGYFGQLNPKQKERIHDINLCGSHLLNLITDILEFSKGEAGKLELVEEKMHMSDMVNEALRIMQEKVKSKRINIITEIDNKIPVLLGDKRKIRQILLNLMSNSIKFTPENGTVKIAVGQDTNENIMMTISDNGIGIAEKDIPVALSVFGQVHRSQSHEGTGLGLPICKMFTELHGGRLAFGSKLGEGTTVRITFPATRNIKEA